MKRNQPLFLFLSSLFKKTMKALTVIIVLLTCGLLGSPETNAEPRLQENEIEGIYMRTVTRYGLGGVYVKNAIYLMLKDGTVYKNLSENPYHLDVAASKQKDAKNWGTWRRNGDVINATWPKGKPQTWKKWFVTGGAKKGERISGGFRSSDPFTGGKVFNVNKIALTEDGRFYWANIKGGETSWRSIVSKSKKKGRYELDRHSITFYNEDDTSDSHLFYFYPGRRDAFGIGKSHFLPLKKKKR